MKVLSLFDGCAGAMQALKNIGIIPEVYHSFEIDKWAIQIAKKNHPEIVSMGAITPYTEIYNEYDLLIGGSPCQDLSIAKANRKGLDGDRSGLFWQYVRVLKMINPKYFLLENVASMSKESKQIITDTLGVEPVMINSSLLTAQNRKRLYWTNIPGVTQPEDRGILLKDIIEYDCDSTLSDRELEYMNRETKDGRTHWDYGLHNSDSENKSKCLVSNIHKGVPYNVLKLNKYSKDTNIPDDIEDGVYSLRERRTEYGKEVRRSNKDKDYTPRTGECKEYFPAADGKSGCITSSSNSDNKVLIKLGHIGNSDSQGNRVYSPDGKSVTLSANGGGLGAKTGLYQVEQTIRKLTPIECERLQGYPDNYSEGVSNTQRYKMMGNSFTVPVIAHILSFMEKI